MNYQELFERLEKANLGEQKKIYQMVLKKSYEQKVFLTHPAELNRQVKTATVYLTSSKKLNIQLWEIFANLSVKQLVIILTHQELSGYSWPPFWLSAQILLAALYHQWAGKISLQLKLTIDPIKHNQTMRREVNAVKKMIKEMAKLGCFHFWLKVSIADKKTQNELSQNMIAYVDYLNNRTEKKPGWKKSDILNANITLGLSHA